MNSMNSLQNVSEINVEMPIDDKVSSNKVEELVNDVLSVSGSSLCCDDTSCNLKNNSECFLRPRDYLENYSTSNADIGNICVQNSTDVSFGNKTIHKTIFNGPVVIKHFIATDVEQKPDPYEASKRMKI